MSARRMIVSLTVATALAGAAGGAAHAADKAKPLDLSTKTEASGFSASGPKTVTWDARRGRWGLTLNLQQPDMRSSNWNDVQAGAYYRITPSLRVGGAVALGNQQSTPPVNQKMLPEQGAPRVRLESTFKF